MKTPCVQRAARRHFNCSTLPGASSCMIRSIFTRRVRCIDVRTNNTGALLNGPHWNQNLFNTELMTSAQVFFDVTCDLQRS